MTPRRMVRARSTIVLVAVALLSWLTLGGSTLGSSAAEPATVLGTLSIDPATGFASTENIRLTTVSTDKAAPGCPVGKTRYAVSVTGPGAWATPVTTFTGGTSATGSEFEAPLAPTFATQATSLGAPLQPGRYDITVTCRTPLGVEGGVFTRPIWFTDATHYQATDPSTTTTTTTVAIEDSPAGRADLGKPVTLTATVTPATAAGVVQFRETLNDAPQPFGSPVRVSGGRAVLVVRTFTFGLHLMSAAFVPDEPKRFARGSTPAPELAFVVAKPIPPVLATPTVTGSPAPGSTLTCTATVTGATSVTYAWLRSGTAITGATKQRYLVTSNDRGRLLACRVTAENAGGVASELSAPVTVR